MTVKVRCFLFSQYHYVNNIICWNQINIIFQNFLMTCVILFHVKEIVVKQIYSNFNVNVMKLAVNVEIILVFPYIIVKKQDTVYTFYNIHKQRTGMKAFFHLAIKQNYWTVLILMIILNKQRRVEIQSPLWCVCYYNQNVMKEI